MCGSGCSPVRRKVSPLEAEKPSYMSLATKKTAELYQEALVLGLDYKLKSKKQQSFRAPLKQRYCYAYNNHGTCPKDNACPHPHVCQICAGKHCRKLCRKFKQKKYKQFTRDPSSSTPKPPTSIKK